MRSYQNQVDAGANIIQIFDYCDGLIPENQLKIIV